MPLNWSPYIMPLKKFRLLHLCCLLRIYISSLSPTMAKHFPYPPELIFHICGFVYSSGLPAPSASPDPLVLSNENGVHTALPSSPAGNWSEPVARRTLANLCLVNRAWCSGAKPWLWRKLEVRLPRSWLSIVDEVVGSYDVPTAEQNAVNIGESIKAVADAVFASSPVAKDNCALVELEERILKRLNSIDSPVPPELLSPPASRDPSPTLRMSTFREQIAGSS
jgi:hypothetical protein